MSEEMLTVGQVAKVLRRHPETILNYEKSGVLPVAHRQPVTNNRLWPRSLIEKLAEQLNKPISV